MGPKESGQNQESSEKASDGRSFHNIPAILPYEAKQALLKEIRHRDNRNLLKPVKESRSAFEANLKPEQNDINQESEEDFENLNKERHEYAEDTKGNILKLDSSKLKTKKSSHEQEERQNKGNFLY